MNINDEMRKILKRIVHGIIRIKSYVHNIHFLEYKGLEKIRRNV